MSYVSNATALERNWVKTQLKQLIQKYPQLTPTQEKATGIKALAGCKASKDLLILSNLRLVLSLARKYEHHEGVDTNELLQDGLIGLIKAAGKFDASKGFRFSTYACWWIQQALLKSFSEHDRLIRVPGNTITQLNQLKRFQEQFESQNIRQASIEELSKGLKSSIKKVNQLLNLQQKPIAIDATENNTDENQKQPIEWLAVNDDTFEKSEHQKQLRRALNIGFKYLNSREKDIINKRYLLEEDSSSTPIKKYTLESLAKDYQITRESIRQSEKRALAKLRQSLILQQMYD